MQKRDKKSSTFLSKSFYLQREQQNTQQATPISTPSTPYRFGIPETAEGNFADTPFDDKGIVPLDNGHENGAFFENGGGNKDSNVFFQNNQLFENTGFHFNTTVDDEFLNTRCGLFGNHGIQEAHKELSRPGTAPPQIQNILFNNSSNEVGGSPGEIIKRSASSAGFDDDDSKTTVRRKIKIEYIEEKSKRHITFSKRKGGIMKKAYELSTLTGAQVLLLIASETGHVYTFATPHLQPMISTPEGKQMIQNCLSGDSNLKVDAMPSISNGFPPMRPESSMSYVDRPASSMSYVERSGSSMSFAEGDDSGMQFENPNTAFYNPF